MTTTEFNSWVVTTAILKFRFLLLILLINSCSTDKNTVLEKIDSHQYDEAIQLLNPIIQKKGKNATYYRKLRAECYVALGKYDSSITDYIQVLAEFPLDKKLHYALGDAFFKSNRINDALIQFKDVISIDSTYMNVNYNVATCMFTLNLDSAAVPYLNRELAVHPNHMETLIMYAEILIDHEEYQLASNLLNRAEYVDSSVSRVYYLKGIVLFKEKKYADAIALYPKAITHSPHIAEYYLKRGITFHLSGKINEAKGDFVECLKLDSSINFARAYLFKHQ